MSHVVAIARKELETLFYSPIAYVCLIVFLGLNGFLFLFMATSYSGADPMPGSPLTLFFSTGFYWIVLWLVIPAITMRLLSEERKQGTLETLMTTPVTETQVVLGKWLSVMAFYAILWATTFAYVFMAAYATGPSRFPIGLTALVVLNFLTAILIPILGTVQRRVGTGVVTTIVLVVEAVVAVTLIVQFFLVRGDWEGGMSWLQVAAYLLTPAGLIFHGASIILESTMLDDSSGAEDDDAASLELIESVLGAVLGLGVGVIAVGALYAFLGEFPDGLIARLITIVAYVGLPAASVAIGVAAGPRNGGVIATGLGFVVGLFVWAAWALDIGPVISGYIGALFVGGVILALGVFVSALTSNQIIAFLVTAGLGVISYFMHFIGYTGMKNADWKKVFEYVSLYQHNEDFARGIVDTSHIVYYLSLIVLFLFLSVLAVGSQRWR